MRGWLRRLLRPRGGSARGRCLPSQLFWKRTVLRRGRERDVVVALYGCMIACRTIWKVVQPRSKQGDVHDETLLTLTTLLRR